MPTIALNFSEKSTSDGERLF